MQTSKRREKIIHKRTMQNNHKTTQKQNKTKTEKTKPKTSLGRKKWKLEQYTGFHVSNCQTVWNSNTGF